MPTLAVLVITLLLAISFYLAISSVRFAATAGAGVWTVQEKELRLSSWASGVIEARHEAKISSACGGEIVWLQAVEGTVVRQSQLLGRLDSRTINAQISQGKALLAVAEANLRSIRSGPRQPEVVQARVKLQKTQAMLDVRLSALSRSRRLNARQVDTLKDLENARAAYLSAKADHDDATAHLALLLEGARPSDIEAAQGRIDDSSAQLMAFGVALSRTEIRSPIAGTIVQTNVHVGEVITPGQVVVRIVDTEALDAILNVEEALAAALAVGQEVELTIDAMPGQTAQGRIVFISPVSSEALKISLLKEEEDSKRFRTRVAIQRLPAGIRVGMSAKARFMTTRRGLFVPTLAMNKQGGTAVLQVISKGTVVERRVRTGVAQDNWVHVTEGVVAGERLILRADASHE